MYNSPHIYLTKLLLLATTIATSSYQRVGAASGSNGSQTSQCQSMWKYPPNCSSNCSYHIVWRYNQQDDGIDFIVTTKYAQRWTGVGFSQDRSMINSDAIIAWIEDGSRYVMMDAWMNSYNTPIADQQQNIHNISAATTNGLISFKFSRKRNTGDTNQDLSFTDDKCLYMIYPVSGGNVDVKSRVLLKHETTPIVSQHPICVRSCQYQPAQQPALSSSPPARPTLPEPTSSGTTGSLSRSRSSGTNLVRPNFFLQSHPSPTTPVRPTTSSTTSTSSTTTTTTSTTPAPSTTTQAPTTSTTSTTTTTTRRPTTTTASAAPSSSSTTSTTTTTTPTTRSPSSQPAITTTPVPAHHYHRQSNDQQNIRQQQQQQQAHTEPILTSSSGENSPPSTVALLPSSSSTTTRRPSTSTTSTTSTTTTSTTTPSPSTTTAASSSSSASTTSAAPTSPDVSQSGGAVAEANQQWCQGRFSYPINCRFYPSSQTQHLQLPPVFKQLNSIHPLPLEHSDCNYYAQWQYLEASDQIEFIIQTKTRNKWTGIGFSNNTRMANSDAIIGLVEENGRHFIMDTWLKDHVMPELDKVQNTNATSAKRENGTTTVKFRRKRITGDPLDFQFTDDACAYFFFPVSGGVFNAVNKRLRQHDKVPIVSKNRICIKSCANNQQAKQANNNQEVPVTISGPAMDEASGMVTKVPINNYNVDNNINKGSESQDETDANDLSPSTISSISSNLDPLAGVSTSPSTTSTTTSSTVNVQFSSSTSGPPLDLSADLDNHSGVPSSKASSASNNPFKRINFLNDSGLRWLAGIGCVATLLVMIMLQACFTVYRNKQTKRQDAINAQWRLAEAAVQQQKVGNKLYNLSGLNVNLPNNSVRPNMGGGPNGGNSEKLVYDDDIDFDHGDVQHLSRDISAKDNYIHNNHSNNHLIGHNAHGGYHQYDGGHDLEDPRGEPFYDADDYFTNSTAAYLNSNNINDCTTATESSGTEENEIDMMQPQNQDLMVPNSYSLGRHNHLGSNDHFHTGHSGHRSHNNRVSGHHQSGSSSRHHQHHHHHQQQQHYARSQHYHSAYNGGGGRAHLSRDGSRDNYSGTNYMPQYPQQQHQMVAPTNSYTLRHNNGYNQPSTLIRPDSYFLPSQRRYSSTNPPS